MKVKTAADRCCLKIRNGKWEKRKAPPIPVTKRMKESAVIPLGYSDLRPGALDTMSRSVQKSPCVSALALAFSISHVSEISAHPVRRFWLKR